MYFILRTAGLGLLLALSVLAVSQEQAAKSGKCSPQRSIEPDGSIVVRNADCTTTTIGKDSVPAKDDAEPKAVPDKSESLMPVAPPLELADPAIREKYVEALSGYYSYRVAGYAHRQRVFQWQLFSSKLIFVVVLLLVCSGIYFAALQFHVGLRRQAAHLAEEKAAAAAVGGKQRASAEAEPDPEVTTFAASLHGIKVSSPVLGVVILTISLAFFYLYLVYVYPITDVF